MREVLHELWREVPMKVRYGLFFMAGVLLVGMCWLTSCQHLSKYPSDNIFEELVEEAIEMKTGQDIDLSPFSPEQCPFKVKLYN